ncbi:MAG TPA: HEAT repeat domain-containing protein [Kofleriaceae bacterium]|jgi:HEAT repeat protein
MVDSIASRVAHLADLVEGPRAYFDVIAIGPAAIPELEHLARSTASTVHQPRGLAVDALAQIGGPEAVDVLLRALADSVARPLDPVLREAEDVVANRICEQLGTVNESRVRNALLDVLRAHAYPACARSLGRLREPRAAPVLARWLGDDTMREPAAEALCALGPAALRDLTHMLVCPRIVAGSEPPTWLDGRVMAATILGALGAEAVELPLVWSLSDERSAVRRAAALALYAHAPVAAEVAAPALIEGLASESWLDREHAANALRTMGAAVATPLALASHTLPRDGTIAALAILAELGHLAALGDLHDHPDRHVRWAAVDSLAKLRSPQARTERARFGRDYEPAIRKRAGA